MCCSSISQLSNRSLHGGQKGKKPRSFNLPNSSVVSGDAEGNFSEVNSTTSSSEDGDGKAAASGSGVDVAADAAVAPVVVAAAVFESDWTLEIDNCGPNGVDAVMQVGLSRFAIVTDALIGSRCCPMEVPEVALSRFAIETGAPISGWRCMIEVPEMALITLATVTGAPIRGWRGMTDVPEVALSRLATLIGAPVYCTSVLGRTIDAGQGVSPVA